MSSKSIFKYGVASAAMLGFAVLGGHGAYAALCGTPTNPAVCASTADFEVVATLTIDEVTILSFGKIQKNDATTGNLVCTVTADGGGGTIGCTGGTGGTAISGHAEGEYTVTGSPNEAFTFTAVGGACGNAGVTLAANMQELGTQTLTAGGTRTMNIGGVLTIADNTVPNGVETCVVTVSAGY